MAEKKVPEVKLRKPVRALVMLPRAGKISVNARKLYNVILHTSANQIVEYESQHGTQMPKGHYFESRLVDLLLPIQVGQSDLRASAKEFLNEMANIRIDWEAPDHREEGEVFEDEDDWVNLGLLSEVRFKKSNPSNKNSEVIVKWELPPGIFNQLRSPQDYKYAQISLYQLTKLSTYESVALYEICARYRTNPNGVTCKQEPIWWTQALSSKVPEVDPQTGLPKWREWRKFKGEKVQKAVQEICENTDLDIQMIEKGGLVQFTVMRKAAEFSALPNKLNPEIADKALALGLRLTDISTLIRNGQSEMALKEAFARMSQQDPSKIDRKLAYLNKILEEVNPFFAAGGLPTKAPVQQELLPKTNTPSGVVPQVAMTYKDERRAEIRKEFSDLVVEEQQPYAYLAFADLKTKNMANPNLSMKIESKAWESAPILFAKMVDIYAVQKYGVDWAVEKE